MFGVRPYGRCHLAASLGRASTRAPSNPLNKFTSPASIYNKKQKINPMTCFTVKSERCKILCNDNKKRNSNSELNVLSTNIIKSNQIKTYM